MNSTQSINEQLLKAALLCVQQGWAVFALGEKSKIPDAALSPNGFKSASKDPEQIKKWWSASPNANIGIALGESDLVALDFDNGEIPSELLARLPETLMVKTARGIHVYFQGACKTGKLVYNGQVLGDIKSMGGYILAPYSQHPDGPTYTISQRAPVAPAPDGLIDSLRGERQASPNASIEGDKIPHGQHDIELTRIAGKLRNIGLEEGAIREHITEVCEKRCEGYGSDYRDMCKKIAASICKHPPGKDYSLVLNNTAAVVDAPPPPIQEQYAMTPEEVDAEMEKEFPVIPLTEQAGPSWDDDVMYGICGDIIRKASQFCEAHPAGMYLDLLTAVGNIIGSSPYFNIAQTRHHANEFMVRVGPTSDGRKGTGRDVVDSILKMVAVKWHDERIMSGFGSAEAIINEVRDPRLQQIADKKSLSGFRTVVVPGINDKRLCIREGEMASVFQLAGKKESRADIVLRDGWDSKPLRNLVKGKSRDGLSNSNVCMEPHLSISGDTTRTELSRKMPDGAAENGFGNRFLYCYVYRTKMCPMGGPDLDWSVEIPKLFDAIQWAQSLTYVPLTKAASKVWGRMYMELESPSSKLPGLAGAMTARAAAHIRRLALIYALLDEFDVVETRHLQAAKRMWDYCQESARFIFTGFTSEQETIRRYIEKNKSVTLGQIRRDVFHDHKKAEWVRSLTEGLARESSSGIAIVGDVVTKT